MKLTKNMRSDLAENICRRLIKRRGIRLAAPKVYVVKAGRSLQVSGRCHWHKGFITLHIGAKTNRRERMVLLVHEFTHYLDYKTRAPSWRKKIQPHGDRFQIMLWKTLAKGLWKRASTGHWVTGPSAHRPEFQIT